MKFLLSLLFVMISSFQCSILFPMDFTPKKSPRGSMNTIGSPSSSMSGSYAAKNPTLMSCITNGKFLEFQELIDQGHTIHHYEPKLSPLYYAIRFNKIDFVDFLLKRGAQIKHEHLQLIISNPTDQSIATLRALLPYLATNGTLQTDEIRNMFTNSFGILAQMELEIMNVLNPNYSETSRASNDNLHPVTPDEYFTYPHSRSNETSQEIKHGATNKQSNPSLITRLAVLGLTSSWCYFLYLRYIAPNAPKQAAQ